MDFFPKLLHLQRIADDLLPGLHLCTHHHKQRIFPNACSRVQIPILVLLDPSVGGIGLLGLHLGLGHGRSDGKFLSEEILFFLLTTFFLGTVFHPPHATGTFRHEPRIFLKSPEFFLVALLLDLLAQLGQLALLLTLVFLGLPHSFMILDLSCMPALLIEER